MKATAFAFDEGTMTDNAFSRSVVDSDQLQAWQDAEGDQVGAVNGIVVSEPLRDAGFEIGTVVTLDRKRSHEICELLAERAHQDDVAVVMVTHDRDVLGHCDRVYEMIDGKLTELEHTRSAHA